MRAVRLTVSRSGLSRARNVFAVTRTFSEVELPGKNSETCDSKRTEVSEVSSVSSSSDCDSCWFCVIRRANRPPHSRDMRQSRITEQFRQNPFIRRVPVSGVE